jgi:hypothetical protein
MTSGLNKILRIPGTGNLVKISTIGSGNTFGARWWTDGKMDAPMMPDDPWLRRHPGNGEMFWCDECEEIATEKPWGEKSQYSDVPFAEGAAESDLQAQLESGTLSGDQERYVRTRLWWIWNDPARNSDEPIERPAGFESNLRRLVELLGDGDGDGDDDSRLMAAEALRQLGDHERASDLLNYPFPDEFQTAVDTIRLANESRDRGLHEIV